MSFRARVLVVCLAVVLVPVLVVGIGVRREVEERIRTQYEERIEALATVIEEDLARESRALGARLQGLTASLEADNRLRAALAGGLSDRSYLLDYAGEAMRLTGLSVLQIQEESGRIVSSGHFRNAFDLVAPALPRRLAALPEGTGLARVRTAEDRLLALARVDSVRLGGRTYHVVGGVRAEEEFLQRLQRDPELRVRLVRPDADGGDGDPDAVLARSVALPYLDVAESPGSGAAPAEARVEITWDGASLEALRSGTRRWLLLVLAGATGMAALLAWWLSARVTRPLEALATRTARIDLDRLDVDFDSDRRDEVGQLARTLGRMTRRLRASARELREAERRATLGELARQVNHDVRNGLAPIRNVLRHLDRVARDEPDALPRVFGERRETIASSVGYLETLAGNYARLSSRAGEGRADAGAVARTVVEGAAASGEVDVRLDVGSGLPPVRGSEVALRRIVENLVTNAVEAAREGGGGVTVRVAAEPAADGAPGVRIDVEDDGPGMTEEARARAFDDFFTTKEEGTGLGLSVVRRLVRDLEGRVELESEPGRGTRVTLVLPAAGADPAPDAAMRSGPHATGATGAEAPS